MDLVLGHMGGLFLCILMLVESLCKKRDLLKLTCYFMVYLGKFCKMY